MGAVASVTDSRPCQESTLTVFSPENSSSSYLGRVVVVIRDKSNQILVIFLVALKNLRQFLNDYFNDDDSMETLPLQDILPLPSEENVQQKSRLLQKCQTLRIQPPRKCKKPHAVAVKRLMLPKKAQREFSSLIESHTIVTTVLGTGIVNQGLNVCYIDSVLQSLRVIPSFRKQLASPKLRNNPLAKEIKRLFATLDAKKQPISQQEIREFRKLCIKNGMIAPEDEMRQQDAPEFCQKLLDALGFAPFSFRTKVTPQNCIVDDSVRSMVAQGGCENHIALPLDRELKYDTLAKVALESFVIEEIAKEKIIPILAGHELRTKENGFVDVPTLQTVQMKIDDIPMLLPIALRRFAFDKSTGAISKISNSIGISETIDFPLLEKTGKKDDDNNPIYEEHMSAKARFRLVSVVVHDGSSPYSGHYRSYVPAYAKEKELYFEFNDSQTQAYLNPTAVRKDIASTGYLHFYEFAGIINP